MGESHILLRAGQRFEGTIRLDPSTLEETSRATRLTIGSYGRGRATIAAPFQTDGIALLDVAGVRVTDLNLVGHGNLAFVRENYRKCRSGPAGIRLQANSPRQLNEGLAVDHVDVSRFCIGILARSTTRSTSIAHVSISNVRTHDNGDAGIWTRDRAIASHSIADVNVLDTVAYRNRDQGGIVLFGVDGARVTDSRAFDNATRGPGGVGIWAFDATGVRFAHNESYSNGNPEIQTDGDGFDFDRGVSNSVMTHNYSHDNGGIGFLVCSCERWARFYELNDIRLQSNVSRDDGSSGQPSLFVFGGEPMHDVRIVSNRIESGVGNGPLVRIGGDHRRYWGVQLRGNRFATRNGKRLLRVDDPHNAGNLTFRGNTWRASGERFPFAWGGRRFATTAAWQAGQAG